MHALLICDINPHRKTKSVINYEKIGCRDHLHSLRMLNSINSTPIPRLPLQGDRRFKAVSEANQTVSPHNCIDRISAEFGWQEGCIHIYTHTHIYNTHTRIYAIHMKYTYIWGQRCLASHLWNAWGCKRVGRDSATKQQQQ